MVTLEAGKAFGEQSLISNKPRLASIVCEKNCHFAVLNKIDFNQILKDFETEKYKHLFKFICSKYAFKGWHITPLKKLYLNSVQKEYKLNDAVFNEGDKKVDSFYIIQSGEFVMYKNIENKQYDE